MSAKKGNGPDANNDRPAKTHTKYTTDFIADSAHQPSTGAGFGLNTFAVSDAEARRFATLKAQFAKHGHTLHQSGPGDGPGPVSYMATRWGLARCLPTLADAEAFLLQVGGA